MLEPLFEIVNDKNPFCRKQIYNMNKIKLVQIFLRMSDEKNSTCCFDLLLFTFCLRSCRYPGFFSNSMVPPNQRRLRMLANQTSNSNGTPFSCRHPHIMPTPEPTPVPVRFDRTGYRQFAVTHDYFPGLLDYINDRSYDTFIQRHSVLQGINLHSLVVLGV